MKTYDLLVILDLAGKEESLPEALASVESEVKAVGGRVARVQKMDRRKFEYVAGALESGFYANLTCELKPSTVAKLRARLGLTPAVYRHILVAVTAEEAAKSQAVTAEASV